MGPRGPGEMGPGGAEVELPEHCLLRLVDVTVQPGKTYRYRLKVRMANPNYKRPGAVANPDWAIPKELESPWWPSEKDRQITVTVEPELRFYAVDQVALERGLKAKDLRELPYRDNGRLDEGQVAFQMHKWVDVLDIVRPGEDRPIRVPVGEWVVAERVRVSRGEYVGRRTKVQVPYWRYLQEKFVLASDAPNKAKVKSKAKKTVYVDFGYGAPDTATTPPEPILVDFEGNSRAYERVTRTEDKETVDRITDACGTTALMLSPEGRLLLHEGPSEIPDSRREERLTRSRQRIQEVEAGRKAGTGGKSGGLDN